MLDYVVVGGGDFAFGVRYGALDATAVSTDAAPGEHHHFPYGRRLRLGWRHDADGRWISDRDDKRLWEVFCAECGDKDGPVETQTEPIQRLRGPYASEHKAKHAAEKHFDEN
jgi:hypothetical protein